MRMKVHDRAVIRWSHTQQMYEVHQGIVIRYRGNLDNCVQWCKFRDLPVRNMDEVNRWKYRNMPVWEGIA